MIRKLTKKRIELIKEENLLSYKEYDTINCCFFSRKNKMNHKRISENKLQGGTVMKYFGTDGFRGEANVNLNVMHAYKVGRFLGWYYGKEHKARVVIGKDTRRSSYMFEDALCAGLTASGADVYLLHVTPTPSVSYVVRTEKFDCGIMISASHNPYYDNGLKVINGKGHKMEAEVEEKIEAYIDSEVDDIPMATRENIGCTIDYAIGRHRYIGYLMSLATRSFKNIKVGLDCANGSSYSVAKGVFDALGAQTFAIGMNPDGTNINDNCGSTHIDNLQKFVVENNLDVGFAYDGDADRCIAVDDKGNKHAMSYNDSWGKILGRDINKFCRFCMDGIGEFADISCGDAWYIEEDGTPDFNEHDGRNITFSRTKKGDELLKMCVKDGVLISESYEINNLKCIQKYQYERRSHVYSRILGM